MNPPTHEAHTIVIGAGPAGLAAAKCLQDEGVDVLVLEASEHVGNEWRHHYRRLHLHTVKWESTLPGLDFPDDVPTYAPRASVVDYFQSYADRFGIAPRFGQRVTRVGKAGSHWQVETESGERFTARNVVVASGYNRIPKRPDIPGIESFDGPVLHSREYVDGSAFRGKRVLVVGAGNSGCEIAICLHEHGALPSLVVRSPMWVGPRDLNGQPAQVTAIRLAKLPLGIADFIAKVATKVMVGDMSRYGIRTPDKGPLRLIVEDGRVSLLDIGTVDLIKRGMIRVRAGVNRIEGNRVHFADGRVGSYDAIVAATGFTTGLSDFLDVEEPVLNSKGCPEVHGTAALPGLHFIGFANVTTGLIREAALQARQAAAEIGRA